MIAVLANCGLILIGTILGLVFRKYIKQELINSILKVLGIVVLMMGLIGMIKSMIFIEAGVLKSRFDLFLLIIIVLGMFIGELLKIDEYLKKFGNYLESKLKLTKISEGFITATIVFVIGAMSIVGSMSAALGDPSILYLKAILDGITSIILAATLGIGVGLSVIPVLFYQGGIVFLTSLVGDFISADFLLRFNLIGYFIVACLGINFLVKEKIKVANILPSLLLVIIYSLIF